MAPSDIEPLVFAPWRARSAAAISDWRAGEYNTYGEVKAIPRRLKDVKSTGWLDNLSNQQYLYDKGVHLRQAGLLQPDDPNASRYPRERPDRREEPSSKSLKTYLKSMERQLGGLKRKAEQRKRANARSKGRSLDQQAAEDEGFVEGGPSNEERLVDAVGGTENDLERDSLDRELLDMTNIDETSDETPDEEDDEEIGDDVSEYNGPGSDEAPGNDDEEQEAAAKKGKSKLKRAIQATDVERIEQLFESLKEMSLEGVNNARRNNATSSHCITERVPGLEREEGQEEGQLKKLLLMPHQQDGVGRYEYIMDKFGAVLLADEMGLGKTLVVIAVIVRAVNRARASGESLQPFCIVVPKSLLQTWMNELAKAPMLSVYCPTKTREMDAAAAAEHDVVLLRKSILVSMYERIAECQRDFNIVREGFEDEVFDHRRKLQAAKTTNPARSKDPEKLVLTRPSLPVFTMDFEQVIIDEGHHIKNPDSQTFRAMNLLRTRKRAACTGTPLQNTKHDLGSLFRFFRLDPLSNPGFFKAVFINKREGKLRSTKVRYRLNDCILGCIRACLTIRRRQNQVFNNAPILGIPEYLTVRYVCRLSDDAQEFQNTTRQFWDFRDKKKTTMSKAAVLDALDNEQDDVGGPPVLEDHMDVDENDETSRRKAKEARAHAFKKILHARLHAIHPHLIHASYGEFGVEDLGELQDSAAAGYDINLEELRAADTPAGETDVDESARVAEFLNERYKKELGSEERKKLARRRSEFLKHFDDNPQAWQSDKMFWAVHTIRTTVEEHVADANKQPTEQLRKEYLATHKILGFCEYLSALDVLEKGLNEHGIYVSRFDGTVPQDDRDRAREAFEEEGKDFSNARTEPDGVQVMLVTNKTGAEGITLVHASDVVILAPCWNPHVEDQLIARAVRAGCTRQVIVHLFIAANSIERRVGMRQYQKRQLVTTILSDDLIIKHGKRIEGFQERTWKGVFGFDRVKKAFRKELWDF